MINVRKRSAAGEVSWEYQGETLATGEREIILEARFNRDDMPFQDIILKRDDRFVETFYTDRWYNIFEIHDRDNDEIKGWYCNVGRPAVWDDEHTISYRDLALDLWVTPDGRQLVLDEDEFEALDLEQNERDMALLALQALQDLFNAKRPAC